MLNEKLHGLIHNFLSTSHVEKVSTSYELWEKTEEGKSVLRLDASRFTNSVCVLNYDKKGRCEFFNNSKELGMKKCIDHFILGYRSDVWELHMIEMKRTVNCDKWEDIKQKFRASHWNITILANFLGISFDIKNVFLYTTYGSEDMSVRGYSNPKGNNLMLGEYIPDPVKEWNEEILTSIRFFPYEKSYESSVKFRHKKIQMSQSNDNEYLEGSYKL